jgi:hypothetical protein
MATGPWDSEEIALLAMALDSKRTPSPSIDIGWFDSWMDGLVSSQEVWDVARDELDLEPED